VLSIGKLAPGQARYYLDQAEARVDVVQSIGDGIEDYYAGGAEARGEWLGAAARTLGLDGPVDGEALRRVLRGNDPWSDEPLRTGRGRATLAGFDLTFSAPKSVSVIFGVGDPDVMAAVRQAHEQAVREAFGYVERSAAAVRRGRGGAVVYEAGGLVAAAYRHRTSRMGDPQLHTHVLVANLGRGPDARWTALDARRIYAHARVASFVYQAVLRGELTRELGVEWTPVRDGIAEIEGVPPQVLRAFSRRRAQIEAALVEHGAGGARAAEAAALATRRRKSASLDGEALRWQWRDCAAGLGFDSDNIARLLHRVRGHALDSIRLAALRTELAGRRGLTYRRSSFGRRDVLLELCERLPPGTKVTARELEDGADAFLSSSRVVPLAGDRGLDADSFRGPDGRRLPVATDERRYSTPELLAVEQRLVGRVRRSPHRAPTAGRAAAAAIAARPSLSEEQRAMVRHLCERDDLVAVITGKAGTGKTYALGAAREAWENAGFPVRGAAVARRASCELRDGAGIESTSVAALLAGRELPRNVVLVVDEAGMIGTRQLSALLQRVVNARGKLVLVGDHRQLPELQAGGVFRGLVHRGVAVELTQNVRQLNAWERDTLDELRDGDAERAMEQYARRGRIISGGDVRRQLVDDWRMLGGDPDQSLMIARRRADVAELNLRARQLLRQVGELGPEELALPGGGFAVGDRVIIKRNAPALDVSNGERGRVVAIGEGGVTLQCGDRRIDLDSAYLLEPTEHGEPSLVHGYTITGHVAQGLTTERTFVLADVGGTREWLYVAMSRGRQTNRLYIADEDRARDEFAPVDPHRPDAWRRLAAALARSEAQPMAIDLATESARDRRGDLRQRRAARRTWLDLNNDFGIDR
jgi:conjugative relaxase-like TrwC/TraI family protein